MIDFKTIENQFQAEYDKVREYMRLLNTLRCELENDCTVREFTFYEHTYRYISEYFFKITDILRKCGVKFNAYSSCKKDDNGEPMLFYKLTIQPREENK